MRPATLLSTCEQAGVFLRLDGDKLKAYGQENAVAQFLPALKAHKEALKAFLSAEEQEFFDERSAIAEYDGGLPRADAEALALAAVQARLNKQIIH